MKNISFLQWTFDKDEGSLRSAQSQLNLPPQQAKLLLFLLNNAGNLLSREEIIAHVWQDKVVNEDALSRSIANLRNTLGDNRQSPIFIETVPKRGYKFIASIEKDAKSSDISIEENSSKLTYPLIFTTLMALVIGIFYIMFRPTGHYVSLSHAINSAERYTADELIEYQPDISASGEVITYTYKKNRNYGISGKFLASQKEFNFFSAEKHYMAPAVSPNDEQLLTAVIAEKACSTVLISLATSKEQRLSSCFVTNESSIFDWSADGNQFLFVDIDKRIDTTAIWLFDLASKTRTQLTFPTSLTQFDTSPRFSPNGEWVSFTRGTGSIRQLYRMKVDKPEDIEQLTQVNHVVLGHHWLTNDAIILDSNKRGDKNLWLLTIDDLTLKNLGAKDGQSPTLDRQNKQLLFQEKAYQANLWQVDLNTNEELLIVSSEKFDNNPKFSANGEQLSFISNRRGTSEVWVYDFKKQQQQLLLAIEGENLVSNKWHSSGQKMLIGVNNDTGYYCVELDIAAAKYEKVAVAGDPISQCDYHPNGNILAITKEESEVSQLVSISNGIATRLTSQGVSNFRVLSNGNIVYTKPLKNGFFIITAQGLQVSTLLAEFPHFLGDHWTISADQLFYLNSNPKELGVWKVDLETEAKSLVSPVTPTAIGQSIAVSSDQSKLIVSKLDRIKSNLYLAQIK